MWFTFYNPSRRIWCPSGISPPHNYRRERLNWRELVLGAFRLKSRLPFRFWYWFPLWSSAHWLNLSVPILTNGIKTHLCFIWILKKKSHWWVATVLAYKKSHKKNTNISAKRNILNACHMGHSQPPGNWPQNFTLPE